MKKLTTISESMRYSERQLTKMHTPTYEWSPQLVQSIQAVRYWRLHLKRLSAINVTDHLLNVTWLASGLPDSVNASASRSELLTNLQGAKIIAARCKTNYVELREAYLSGLADAIIS